MQLHDLKPAPGSRKERTRVGRGDGSGKGKTAGRGTKGQKARGTVRRGFEGGQNPIYKRLSYRRGFVNIFKTVYEVVNVGRLNELDIDGPITPEVLYERGVTRGLEYPVKILGDGEVTRPLTVRAHKFSKSAREKIEAAGGTVEAIS
ncbi:50S ribosomal protein L15 [Sphaerobacter sp.]|uniref:50S ribosomal protein L15 n=1 Tax=Sphaerobacter sp. TaxID=2099654 RepID=UPI001DD8185D|nr:50S ribosomal protein L15 [Sphaerobacter sp.]MBX5444383.1 50S ribosomal protein L15 [Sphaerobacter sp.]